MRTVSRNGIFSLRGEKIRKYQTPLLTSSSLWQGLGCPHTQGHFKHLAKKETGHFSLWSFHPELPSEFLCHVPINSRKDFTLTSCLRSFNPQLLGPLALGQNILSGEYFVEAAVDLTWQCLKQRKEREAYSHTASCIRPCFSQWCHPSVTAFQDI